MGALGSKSQEIYEKFFKIINQKCLEKFSVNFVPEVLLTDHETRIISALKTIFPVSIHCGCLFHLTQCTFRKLQELGFSQDYAKDKNFQKISKKAFGLPFLTEHEKIAAFYYKTTIADIQQYPQLSSFLNYVYDFCFNNIFSSHLFSIMYTIFG